MSVNRFMVPPYYDNDRFETLRLLLVDGSLPRIRRSAPVSPGWRSWWHGASPPQCALCASTSYL